MPTTRADDLIGRHQITYPGVQLSIHYAAIREASNANFTHRHDHYQLTVVTRGRMLLKMNGRQLTMSRGDAIVVSPFVWHNQQTYGDPGYEFFVLPFDLRTRDRPDETDIIACELWEIGRLFTAMPDYCVLRASRCAPLAETMRPTAGPAPLGREAFLLSACVQVITAAAEGVAQRARMARPRTADSPGRSTSHVAIEIAKYLHANHSREIKVEEVAAQFGFTVRHLQRLFHDFFDSSFTYSLRAIRLNYAKEYLAATDMTVAQVAQAAGFSSARAFAEALRRAEGMSPGDYRERVRD